jgi:magnesium chelatase family protein
MSRFKNHQKNGTISVHILNKFTKLSSNQKELLGTCIEQGILTARSCNKIIRVAQTLSDLENTDSIEDHHLTEAMQYRQTLFKN